jgi:hypothetical protein
MVNIYNRRLSFAPRRGKQLKGVDEVFHRLLNCLALGLDARIFTHVGILLTLHTQRILHLKRLESGQRESNSHSQLGRLELYH